MFPATAHTLSMVTATQNDFEPGKVERRIIAYFFEGLKYDLYNLVSLRLGRNSREAETCKDKLRQLIAAVKRVCYEMINEELDSKVLYDSDSEGQLVLEGHAIAEIVGYITQPDDVVNGSLWLQLEPLFDYTFKSNKQAIKFLQNQVINYVQTRVPMLETNYAEQWAGAVDYITKFNQGR